jgi:hypothetical protein
VGPLSAYLAANEEKSSSTMLEDESLDWMNLNATSFTFSNPSFSIFQPGGNASKGNTHSFRQGVH